MPIPIRFMTVVIKKHIIEEKYPGGLKGFMEDQSCLTDEHLIGVTFMSSGDVTSFLDVLRSLGFALPACCAIGDQHLGPMDRCPGIEFYALTPDAAFDKQWRAVAVMNDRVGNRVECVPRAK